MKMLAVIVFAFATASAPAIAAPLTCQWTEKHECSPGSGCKTIKVTTFAKVDLALGKYSRCDRNGCDTYDANVSGTPKTYRNVDVTGRGVFLKFGPDGKSTEVVSLMNTVLISQGICR
jgi:hypothetical protein